MGGGTMVAGMVIRMIVTIKVLALGGARGRTRSRRNVLRHHRAVVARSGIVACGRLTRVARCVESS